MKSKILVLIITCLFFVIHVVLGFSFYEYFSEYFIFSMLIYFGILIFNFFCLHWKDNLIANFIIEKNINYIFIFLAIIYLAVFIVTFIKFDGLNKLMYCTVWISLINVCLSDYLYLKNKLK